MISLAYRENKGATGGPGGINYLMMICNEKYHEIQNIQFEFKNKDNDLTNLEILLLKITNKLKKVLKLNNSYILQDNIKFIDELVEKYENRLYISHDPISSYLLLKKKKNCITVYHQQGSLYNEYLSFGGKSDEQLKIFYSKIEKEIIDKSKYIVFPSKGALRAFISTTDIDEIYKDKVKNRYKVIYNTIDESISLQNPDSFEEINKKIDNKKVFLTVSSLTTAKGVDLIVNELLKIKNFSKDYVWILCGSGVLEQEIYTQIERYKLQKNFIHISRRMNQSELKFFYERATFYIMMHRHSIFDLATLEAMYNFTIPVLSYEGGNIEISLENNAIFKNEIENINSLNKNEIEELKSLNNSIYHKYFSQKNFIKNYKKLIELK